MNTNTEVISWDIRSVVRSAVWALQPYSSARDEYQGSEGIFLDANENAWGSVAKLPDAFPALNRYPDPLQRELKAYISKWLGIAPEHIFVGNGSDEAIDLLIRACCEPAQDHILTLPPTYGMYQVSAQIQGVRVKEIPLTPDFDIDLNATLNALNPHTKIIFICSPNNPTANLLSLASIQAIAEKAQGLVVIDEAYIDFCPNPQLHLPLLQKYPNIVLLRTFSKAWGMAALRLGMALANPALVQVLHKIKPPYNLNALSQQIGIQALQPEGIAQKEFMVRKTIQQREVLAEELQKFAFVLKVYPSEANFVLVKVTQAEALMQFLIDRKIIVRNRSKVILCENCLRITIGTAHENAMLLQNIAQFAYLNHNPVQL